METNYSTQQPVAAPYAGTHERIEQFKQEIAGLDVKAPADDKERVFLMGAFALMALGVVAILGGYWGASGSPIVAEQVPYLLSGGVLGLGFIIAGAALFVRYSLSRYLRFWLVREIYEQRAQTDRLVESLTSIEALLSAATRPRAKAE
jgi:hypothetical protein